MDKKTRPIYAVVAILKSRKIGFKTKAMKRQRKALCNDKGISPTRGYNPCKHLCTEINKTNVVGHKGRDINCSCIRGFKTPLTSMPRYSR